MADSREFARALRIALYAELPDEMPMEPLFEAIRAAGKLAFLPKLPPGAPEPLRFHRVDSWEDLAPGRYGVREPESDASGGLDLSGLDLVVVPGLIFDRAGRRLGRGGGYYDRTLAESRSDVSARTGSRPRAFRVGAAFAWQVVDRVPAGPLDQRVDAVVTEREWIRVPRYAATTAAGETDRADEGTG